MRFRPPKSANGSRFNTRTACLSRFPVLLSPDGNFSTATSLKVSWHFQCWPAPKNSKAIKMRKGKYVETLQDLHKVCITPGNGAIFARTPMDNTEWAEPFKFPADSLSLILFSYSSFPSVYCRVQNAVSFQDTESQQSEFSSLFSKVLLCNGEMKGTKIKSCYILEICPLALCWGLDQSFA